MGAPNAPGSVRELVVSQRHIYRRDLGRLLHPADRLRQGHLRVEVLEGQAAVHEERRVRVAGRDAVDADALLDQLSRHTADEAAQGRLGGRVGDRALERDQARYRVGDDDGGPWGQERSGGLDDVEVCVDIDLHDVVPNFRRRLGNRRNRTDGPIIVSLQSVLVQKLGYSFLRD